MKNPACSCFLPVRKILCATDFSAASYRAFHAAIRLCSSLQATLTIINVVEYAHFSAEDNGWVLASDTFHEEAESLIHSLVQEAKSAGVVCTGMALTGIAHSCIVETQQLERIDLVVLGTRSIRGFERLVFGSTAEAVLRSIACPVLTVGPLAAEQTFESCSKDGTVLFASDFNSRTTDALNYAAWLAEKLYLRLHCLNVLPRSVRDDIHEGIIPAIVKEGLAHLITELDGERIAPLCAVTYGSEVSTAVVEYARAHPTKLIVLGVQRASLAASHIPAHIVYRVIAEAPCAVMTIAFEPNHSPNTPGNQRVSGMI